MSSIDIRSTNPFQESISRRNSTIRSTLSLFQIIREVSTSKDENCDEHNFYLSHQLYDSCPGSISIDVTIRSLTLEERETLSGVCQCQSDNWNNIFLMYNKDHYSSDVDLSSQIKHQIKNCSFQGWVVLGICMDSNQNEINTGPSTLLNVLKPAVKNNTIIKDSIIAPGAKVFNNTLISDSFVGPTSSIINCGSIHHKSRDNEFNDILTMTLGPESGGGRHISVKPESTLVGVCSSLGISKYKNEELLESKPTAIPFNVILGDVQFVQMGSNIYISESAAMQSCPSITNVILLPQSSIKNSTIESTFLQWKSSIIDSNVSTTILMECADIGPSSIVTSTVIGPDSHVSCGEVHCSLIGPNTNSHHQSLVISVLWPMGRGNVGYGSNIGSNHTGRIPDQECTAGEGIFWGLGCVIKFPVDLSRSFYSVVAAGVQLPPQRVSMPFSLIMSGKNGNNEIVPGWLSHSSPYTILRSEDKFKKRRKAKRHDFYCGWKIIRPSIIDACWKARESLQKLNESAVESGQETSGKGNCLYTKSDLIELGENTMTERGRKVGIEAYTNIIQRYALTGLYVKVNSILEKVSVEEAIHQINILWSKSNQELSQSHSNYTPWPVLPWEEESHNDQTKVTEHQLFILSRELKYMTKTPMAELTVIVTLLKKMISLELNFLERVKKSKSRDDKRGAQIIPNYNDAHILASNDPVVEMAKVNADEIVSKCKEIISSLESASPLNSLQSKL